MQIKWLYKNDCESRFYESESEEEESSSADECGSLAVHLSRFKVFQTILKKTEEKRTFE